MFHQANRTNNQFSFAAKPLHWKTPTPSIGLSRCEGKHKVTSMGWFLDESIWFLSSSSSAQQKWLRAFMACIIKKNGCFLWSQHFRNPEFMETLPFKHAGVTQGHSEPQLWKRRPASIYMTFDIIMLPGYSQFHGKHFTWGHRKIIIQRLVLYHVFLLVTFWMTALGP